MASHSRNTLSNFSQAKPAATPSASKMTPISQVSPQNREDMYIVALCETRQREVGIAAYDIRSGRMRISQSPDTHSYVHTTTRLFALDPVEIIVPHTQKEAELTKLLATRFPETAITLVDRKYFSEEKGLSDIRKLCLTDFESQLEHDGLRMWLAMAAASALISYIQQVQNISFQGGKLPVAIDNPEAFMAIDSETIKNLEIISNNRSANTKFTLFGILNHTKTTVGTRQLKTALLQPLKCLDSINARLDAVEVFRLHPDTLFEIQNILSQCLDIDKILYNLRLVHTPASDRQGGPMRCFSVLKNIAAMKNLLEWIPRAAEVLARLGESQSSASQPVFAIPIMPTIRSALLAAIAEQLNSPTLESLAGRISEVINPDTNYRTTSYHLRVQLAFAVKPRISGLLDVARKTYSETMDDIHNLIAQYRAEFGLESLRLNYNHKRGHHISIDINSANERLPDVFIQASGSRSKVFCSTEELEQLSQRNRQSLEEVVFLSERVIKFLHEEIREHAGAIYKVSDAIAMLDFLSSLAQYAAAGTAGGPMIRPKFDSSETAALVIQQGRHPIAEAVSVSARYDPTSTLQHESALGDRSEESTMAPSSSMMMRTKFVPNDFYAAPMVGNFQVLTGSNMSGKTTQLTQLGTLIVLAQIGSFIPAKFASLRVTDRLFTRLGTSDSLEHNNSAFSAEMSDCALILKNISPKSVVLIDELGRGTSTRDGLAISWAISERLLQSTAYTILVTHFRQLCKLQEVYPNVRNFHLGSAGHDKSHVRQPGPTDDVNYGIRTAMQSGMNAAVIEQAKVMLKAYTEMVASNEDRSEELRDEVNLEGRCAELLQRVEHLKFAPVSRQQEFLRKAQEEARLLVQEKTLVNLSKQL